MKKLLIWLNACDEAMEWADGKSWKEIFDTCNRGGWLLWLFCHTKTDSEEDFTLLTHAKGHCANTVRHLMKYERSLAAVDAAMNYNGDRKALKDAAVAANYVAAANTYDVAAYAAASAADADDADAADAAYAAAADAREKNRMETADIVRKYIPIEKWNIAVDLGWDD